VIEPKKLNIAMLGHKRIPSREGGIEIVVEELSTRMSQRGQRVTCYNRSGHHVSGAEYDSTTDMKKYKNITLKTVPTINIKGIAAVSSSFFASLFASLGQYDVVHIHAEGPAAFCWIPKFFGKRVVITIHGLDWRREKWQGKFGSKYIHFGEKMAVKFADELVVLSKGIQDYFRQTYRRETHYIPNGISKPDIKSAKEIKDKFGLDKDSYVLYLGRIVPEKGEHYLIKAWRRVKTNKKLVIAGGSSDSDEYMKNLEKLAEGDYRIIFTGFVQGRMLSELYSNCYLYVLPSDLEGMPLSLLEAMSFGNCCLVSDIEECSSVVEEKAVMFRKSDVSSLAESLQRLLDGKEIVERYKHDAANFILNKYDWNKVIEETLCLYER